MWLVQNCRSNKCLIPQTPELPGGFVPLVPCQGSAVYPLGTLSGPQTPRLLTPPPNHKSWIRPWNRYTSIYIYIMYNIYITVYWYFIAWLDLLLFLSQFYWHNNLIKKIGFQYFQDFKFYWYTQTQTCATWGHTSTYII